MLNYTGGWRNALSQLNEMLELYRRVMEQFGGLVGIQVLRRALAQVHDLKGALLVVDRNKFRIRRR